MADIHTAVTSSILSAQQAVILATDLALANSVTTQTAASSEIVALIAASRITATATMTVLTGLAANGTAVVEGVVAAEINALIAANQITATTAVANIAAALNVDRAVVLLTYVAESGSAAVLAAVGNEIASLVHAGSLTATAAVNDIYGISDTVTVASVGVVIPVLISSAAAGDTSLRNAVNALLATLITPSSVPSSYNSFVVSDLQSAVAPATLAQYLANYVTNYGVPAAAINSDITAAVLAGDITASTAILLRQYLAADLGTAWNAAGGAPLTEYQMGVALAGAAAADITPSIVAATMWSLIDSGHASIDSLLNGGLNAGTLSGAQSIALLLALAADAPSGSAGTLTLLGLGSRLGAFATAAEAVADVEASLALHQLTGEQAVTLLVIAAGNGGIAVQIGVGADIAAHVQAGTLSVSDAVSIIDTAVGQFGRYILSDVGFGILLGMAVNGAATTASAAIQEMLDLSTLSYSPASAMADIDSALTSAAITANEAITVLAALAGAGDTAMRGAVTQEIYALIDNNHITAAQAMSDLGSAVTSNLLSVGQAVAMIEGLAAQGGLGLQMAVGGEFAALVQAAQLTAAVAANDVGVAVANQTMTADQAFDVLLGMAISGDSATVNVALAEMAVLVQPAAAMTNLDAAISSSGITIDQAMNVLFGLAAAGTGAMQAAVAGEIVSFIATSRITSALAISDIGDAVTTSQLTGDQAVILLTGIAGLSSTTVQVATGAEIAALIAAGQLTANAATTDITTAVTAGSITADQAVQLLLGMAVSGNGAAASAAELAMATVVTPAALMADINAAISASAITSAQALVILVVLANAGTTGMQSTVVDEIDFLITNSQITVAQGMPVLLGLAAIAATATQIVVANEIDSLIANGRITASQAAANIGDAVGSNVITAAKAVTLLTYIAVSGTGPVLIAAEAEISALVTAGSITATAVVNMLTGLAGAASGAMQSTLVAEINALIAAGQATTTQAINSFTSAELSGVLTADQTVNLLTYLAASAPDAKQSAIASVIVSYVAQGDITADQAVADIIATQSNGVSADRAIVLLINVASAGNADAQTSAIAAISNLARNAPPDVVQPLLFLAGNPFIGTSDLDNIGANISSYILNRQISTGDALNDISDAIGAGILTGAQALEIQIYGVNHYPAAWGIDGSFVQRTPNAQAIHAITLLAGLSANGNVAFEISTAMAANAIINAGQISPTAVANLIAGQPDADQAITTLAAMSGAVAFNAPALYTNPIEALAISGAIASLMQGGAALHAGDDIGNVVAAGALSGLHAVELLMWVAARGDAGVQANAGAVAAGLIDQGSLTTDDFLNNSDLSVLYSLLLNPDQRAMFYAGAIASSDAAPVMQAAITTQLLTYVAYQTAINDIVANLAPAAAAVVLVQIVVQSVHSYNADAVLTAATSALTGLGPTAAAGIAAQVVNDVITADQGIVLMSSQIGNGTGSNALVASQIVALIGGNQIAASQAVADIGNAVGIAITADQAVALLTILSIQSDATLRASARGELSSLIGNNQVSVSQTMTDIGATIAGGTLTADQAIALMTSLAGTGTAGVQAAAGTEIVALIAANQISAAQAMIDIDQAIGTNALSVEQGIVVLTSVAVGGTVPVLTAVINEMSALVIAGQLTATQVATDIAATIGTGTSVDQVISLLAGVSTFGNSTLQAAASAEILLLIANGQITATQAMNDIGATISAGTLTGDQAIAVLAKVADSGSVAVQSAAIAEIAALIAASEITTVQVIADLNAAMALNLLTFDRGIAVLASLGMAGDLPVLIAVIDAMSSLVVGGQVTAPQAVSDIAGAAGATLTIDQAVIVLAAVSTHGNTALESAANVELLALIGGNQITAAQAMSDIGSAIAAATLTAAEGLTVMAALTGAGPTGLQVVFANEIATLVATNQVTAVQVKSSLDNAVTSGLLSADQGVAILASMFIANAALRPSAVSELIALVAESEITAAQVTADITTMIGAGFTSTQAIGLMASLWIENNTAVHDAVSAQLAALISGNQIPAAVVAADIGATIASQQLTADQAVALLLDVAGTGTAAVRSVIGAELAALVQAGQVTTAQAFADLEAAVASNVLTIDQSVALLAAMAANGHADVQTAVAVEIALLVTANTVAAAQAAGDIGAAIGSGIDADQAITLLAILATQPDGTLQSAATDEILALIAGGQITAAQAMIDIGNTISSGTLTDVQVNALLGALASAGPSDVDGAVANEIALLQGVAGLDDQIHSHNITAVDALPSLINIAGSNPGLQSAVVDELRKLMAEGLLTGTDIMTAIGVAIGPGFTADQAISLLISLPTQGDTALQNVVGVELAALIAGSQVTVLQLMQDILTAVNTQWGYQVGATYFGAGTYSISADQAVGVLIALAANAPSTVQAMAGSELDMLIRIGAISAAGLAATIDAAVSSGVLTADQAVTILAGAVMTDAATASGVDALLSVMLSPSYPNRPEPTLLAEIAALVADNRITATAAVADIVAAASVQPLIVDYQRQYYYSYYYYVTASLDQTAINSGNMVLAELVSLFPQGNAALQSAIGAEIVSLIAQNQFSTTNVLAYIGNATPYDSIFGYAYITPFAGLLSPDQVMALFANIAAHGDDSVVAAVGSEIAALCVVPTGSTTYLTSAVVVHFIDAAQAVSDIHLAFTSGVVSGATALGVLAAMGTDGTTTLQTTVIAEIGSLAGAGSVSAVDAVLALAAIGVAGNSAVQLAAVNAIDILVNADQIAAAVALPSLLQVVGKGSSGVLAAVVTEMISMVAASRITADQATLDVGSAIGAGLTAEQAITVLATLSFRTGGALQTSANSEIAALVVAGQITAPQALADIANVISANGLNETQGLALLISVAATGNVALAAQVGYTVANIYNGLIHYPYNDYNSLNTAIFTIKASSLDLVPMFTVLAAIDGSSGDFLVGSYLSTHPSITTQQAADALVQVAGQGPASLLNAVAIELTGIARISSSVFAAAVSNGVASNTISGYQAVEILGAGLKYTALPGNSSTAYVTASIAEMTSLITQGQMTAIEARSYIGTALTSQFIDIHSAVRLLVGVSGVSLDEAVNVGAALASYVTQGQLTIYGLTKDLAVGNAISATQTVALFAGILESLPATLLLPLSAGGQLSNARDSIASNVANFAIRTVGTGTLGILSADQIIATLDGVAGTSANIDAAGIFGVVIGDMVALGYVTLAQAVGDITYDVTHNVIGADQAIGILAGTAGALTGSGLYAKPGYYIPPNQGAYATATAAAANIAAIGAEIAGYVNGGRVTAAQVMSDIDASTGALALSPEAAVMLLGAIAANANGNTTLQAAAAAEIGAVELAKLGISVSDAPIQASVSQTAADFVLVVNGQMTVAQAIADIESYAAAHFVSADMMLSVLLLEAQGNHLQSTSAAIATEISNRINNDAAEAGLAQLVANGTITAQNANQIITQSLTVAWPYLPPVTVNLSSVPSGSPYSSSISGGVTTPLTLAGTLGHATDLLNRDIVAFVDAGRVLSGAMTAAAAIADVEAYGGSIGYVVDIALMHLAAKIGAGIVTPQSDLFYQQLGLDASDIQLIHDTYNAQTLARTTVMQELAERLATGSAALALLTPLTNGYMSAAQGIALIDAEVATATMGLAAGQTTQLRDIAHAWIDILANTVIDNGATSLKNAALAVQSQIESGGVATLTALLGALGTINAVESNAGYNSVELLVTHLTELYIRATLPANPTGGDVTNSANAAAKWFQDRWNDAWQAYPLSSIIGHDLIGNAGNATGYIKLLSQLVSTGLPGGSTVVSRFMSLVLPGNSTTMGEALGLQDVNGQSLDGTLNNALKQALGNDAAIDPDDLAASNSLLEVLENPALIAENPALEFTLVSLASHGMVALLTTDSVSNFLSKNPITGYTSDTVLASMRLIADSCELVTNMVTGTITTFVTQSYDLATDLITVFGDVFLGESAADDAAALGKALFQYATGFEYQNAVTVGEDIGNAVVDLFTGHPLDLANDIAQLGDHAIKLLLDNPYLKMAASTLATYGNQVASILHLDVVYNGLVAFSDWFNANDPGLTSNDPKNPGFFSSYVWGEVGRGIADDIASWF